MVSKVTVNVLTSPVVPELLTRKNLMSALLIFEVAAEKQIVYIVSYHSGATEDLDAVIQHIISTKEYPKIYLKGFSLGGNILLKYLGEGRVLPSEIKAGVAISVPCNLHSSLKQLLSLKNYLYARRFKKHLIQKLIAKQKLFPNKISNSDIKNVKNLKDFDDIYTSRAHNFIDALDYYQKCSCLQFLSNISIPCLLINAKKRHFFRG